MTMTIRKTREAYAEAMARHLLHPGRRIVAVLAEAKHLDLKPPWSPPINIATDVIYIETFSLLQYREKPGGPSSLLCEIEHPNMGGRYREGGGASVERTRDGTWYRSTAYVDDKSDGPALAAVVHGAKRELTLRADELEEWLVHAKAASTVWRSALVATLG
jgi:hypothetical protein